MFYQYSHRLEENISYDMNLVSQLDTLVCEIGVQRSIDTKKLPFATKYGQHFTWNDYIRRKFLKKLVNFVKYLSLNRRQ